MNDRAGTVEPHHNGQRARGTAGPGGAARTHRGCRALASWRSGAGVGQCRPPTPPRCRRAAAVRSANAIGAPRPHARLALRCLPPQRRTSSPPEPTIGRRFWTRDEPWACCQVQDRPPTVEAADLAPARIHEPRRRTAASAHHRDIAHDVTEDVAWVAPRRPEPAAAAPGSPDPLGAMSHASA